MIELGALGRIAVKVGSGLVGVAGTTSFRMDEEEDDRVVRGAAEADVEGGAESEEANEGDEAEEDPPPINEGTRVLVMTEVMTGGGKLPLDETEAREDGGDVVGGDVALEVGGEVDGGVVSDGITGTSKPCRTVGTATDPTRRGGLVGSGLFGKVRLCPRCKASAC